MNDIPTIWASSSVQESRQSEIFSAGACYSTSLSWHGSLIFRAQEWKKNGIPNTRSTARAVDKRTHQRIHLVCHLTRRPSILNTGSTSGTAYQQQHQRVHVDCRPRKPPTNLCPNTSKPSSTLFKQKQQWTHLIWCPTKRPTNLDILEQTTFSVPRLGHKGKCLCTSIEVGL